MSRERIKEIVRRIREWYTRRLRTFIRQETTPAQRRFVLESDSEDENERSREIVSTQRQQNLHEEV